MESSLNCVLCLPLGNCFNCFFNCLCIHSCVCVCARVCVCVHEHACLCMWLCVCVCVCVYCHIMGLKCNVMFYVFLPVECFRAPRDTALYTSRSQSTRELCRFWLIGYTPFLVESYCQCVLTSYIEFTICSLCTANKKRNTNKARHILCACCCHLKLQVHSIFN